MKRSLARRLTSGRLSILTDYLHRENDIKPDSNRITIWYLITALTIGGAERTLVNLANNVDRDLFDVTVWSIFEQNPLASELDDDVSFRTLGVSAADWNNEDDYIESAEHTIDYVRAPLRFALMARREQPNMIQSFLFNDNMVARIGGMFSPNVVVITGARGLRNNWNDFQRVLDRVTIALSDRIVSNSNAGAEYFTTHGAPRDSVTVIHNGRDLDRYRGASPAKLRNEIDLPESVTLVGTVGRLVERKGHFDLLEACPDIRERHPSVHFVIVGDGSERATLEKYARELNVKDYVHFLGTRRDVPELLSAMDLFVFPSHYEGLPGALLEAMAAGLPIVATRVEGNTELVTDGDDGVLVPPKNPAALADGVSSLLSNPSRSEALGCAAQKRAYEHFTLDAMVSNFERFYESVLRQTDRSHPSIRNPMDSDG